MEQSKAEEILDEFIDMMNSNHYRGKDIDASNALKIMIQKHQPKITEHLTQVEDFESFHKIFRQTDATNCPEDDMVIWHLLHASRLFSRTFEDVLSGEW